jgi:hypothetical protein
MVKVFKPNYGFFEAEQEDIVPFFRYIVFNKNNVDMYWDVNDFEEIKKILKSQGWEKESKKTYENKEVEVVFKKENNKKLMFYYDK